MKKLRVLLLALGVWLVISISDPNMAMSAWPNDPSVVTTICNAGGNQYAPG